MTAMAAMFELVGESDEPFRSAIMFRAKRAAVGSNKELNAKNRAKECSMAKECIRLQTTVGVGTFCGRTQTGAQTDGMDQKARWLVIGMGFSFGQRVGQFTLL